MFQVRIHGRGGQGVVTAAEMLSVAAFLEGEHAQAFPSFGSERTGAPVVAFCRIDDRPIRVREPVMEPNALIISDPTLIHQVDLFSGLRPDGYVLINSGQDLSTLGLDELLERFQPEHLLSLPGTDIARRHIGRPLPNAVLLAGLAALTDVVQLPSIREAIAQTFSGAVAKANDLAACEAYEVTVDLRSRRAEQLHLTTGTGR